MKKWKIRGIFTFFHICLYLIAGVELMKSGLKAIDWSVIVVFIVFVVCRVLGNIEGEVVNDIEKKENDK